MFLWGGETLHCKNALIYEILRMAYEKLSQYLMYFGAVYGLMCPTVQTCPIYSMSQNI